MSAAYLAASQYFIIRYCIYWPKLLYIEEFSENYYHKLCPLSLFILFEWYSFGKILKIQLSVTYTIQKNDIHRAAISFLCVATRKDVKCIAFVVEYTMKCCRRRFTYSHKTKLSSTMSSSHRFIFRMWLYWCEYAFFSLSFFTHPYTLSPIIASKSI